ncbi:hypothetical protein GCM10010372_45640 [Streptomyces tauricus]|nr:hypothetical protein GCM10010372_45640 [Streptomyces tauricus]
MCGGGRVRGPTVEGACRGHRYGGSAPEPPSSAGPVGAFAQFPAPLKGGAAPWVGGVLSAAR